MLHARSVVRFPRSLRANGKPGPIGREQQK
jgi:hypothetical protein